MKVPYFKKQKMYKVVSELLAGICMCKMIDSSYRFYRGSEWLYFMLPESEDDCCIYVSFYHSGYFFSLDMEYRDENYELHKVVRQTYRLQSDSSLKLEYFSERDF